MQLWTVPHTSKYKIICYGAKGCDAIFEMSASTGNKTGCPDRLSGGKGASVGGIIQLFKRDVIKIAVGQMGETSSHPYGGGGGGGATYFVLYKSGGNNPKYKNNRNDILNIPLIIAAGGHGACCAWKWDLPGIDGLCDSSEHRNNHGGYVSNGCGARGASFRNDFNIFKSHKRIDDRTVDYNECNPRSFINGAVGGAKGTYGSVGGFGGGGGSAWSGGGGGGFIGGLVSPQYDSNIDIKKCSLYGALSLNSCQNNKDKVMISGCNNGNGKIEVEICGKLYT